MAAFAERLKVPGALEPFIENIPCPTSDNRVSDWPKGPIATEFSVNVRLLKLGSAKRAIGRTGKFALPGPANEKSVTVIRNDPCMPAKLPFA